MGGIAFSAQVQLVHLEPCALHFGWLPEQLRNLGLDLQRDEEIIWPTTDRVESGIRAAVSAAGIACTKGKEPGNEVIRRLM